MRVYVCVKHVPDSAAKITIIGKTRIDESVTFLMNPYDEHAIEEAARLKQQVGVAEIIAVSLGKADAANTIQSALAMGADRGILVTTDSQPDSKDRITARRTRSDPRRFTVSPEDGLHGVDDLSLGCPVPGGMDDQRHQVGVTGGAGREGLQGGGDRRLVPGRPDLAEPPALPLLDLGPDLEDLQLVLVGSGRFRLAGIRFRFARVLSA